METKFEDRPETRIGRNAEKLVAKLLRDKGWFVIPSYDYSGKGEDKAPRLQGKLLAHVVPDLDVARDGIRKWAEVKAKSSATLHRITNRLEHGIPKKHFQDYLEVQRITGDPVFIFILELDTRKLLFEKLDILAPNCREYGGSKMSRGGMVFFPRDAFDLFATIDA